MACPLPSLFVSNLMLLVYVVLLTLSILILGIERFGEFRVFSVLTARTLTMWSVALRDERLALIENMVGIIAYKRLLAEALHITPGHASWTTIARVLISSVATI